MPSTDQSIRTQHALRGMRLTPSDRQDRLTHMSLMRVNGATLQDIGDEFGLTRERTRQILSRAGVERASSVGAVDPIKLLAEVRKPGVRSIAAAARSLGISQRVGWQALRELGLCEAARRLFTWRHHRRTIDNFRTLAARLGRTPTVADLREARIPGLHQANVQARFGGMQNLARRAGLVPNRSGRRPW